MELAMPISREEFDNRGIDFRIHIRRILRASPGEAYSESELIELVEVMIGLKPDVGSFALALIQLETAGEIEEAILEDIRFWAIRVG